MTFAAVPTGMRTVLDLGHCFAVNTRPCDLLVKFIHVTFLKLIYGKRNETKEYRNENLSI